MEQRKSRYVIMAQKALQLCQAKLPCYTHLNSPHRFTQPQLLACVLLMFYVHKSYRDMEEWLLASDQLVTHLHLSKVPDHTTLWRTFNALRRRSLDQLLADLLAQLELAEDLIGVDTTGYQLTQASLHYLDRRGFRYDYFIKGGYAVGAQSQLILAWKSGIGPGADQPFLEPLRRGATRYGKHTHGRIAWTLLGDAGFDSVTVRDTDLVPPIRRGGVMRSQKRIERLERVSAARMDGIYGQRWICETANSVIKRKFGDTIRSRKDRLIHLEPYVKGLVYNLHRLVVLRL